MLVAKSIPGPGANTRATITVGVTHNFLFAFDHSHFWALLILGLATRSWASRHTP